jgi:hypothetical protein
MRKEDVLLYTFGLAYLPDMWTSVVKWADICLYSVWYSPYHFTHPVLFYDLTGPVRAGFNTVVFISLQLGPTE